MKPTTFTRFVGTRSGPLVSGTLWHDSWFIRKLPIIFFLVCSRPCLPASSGSGRDRSLHEPSGLFHGSSLLRLCLPVFSGFSRDDLPCEPSRFFGLSLAGRSFSVCPVLLFRPGLMPVATHLFSVIFISSRFVSNTWWPTSGRLSRLFIRKFQLPQVFNIVIRIFLILFS